MIVAPLSVRARPGAVALNGDFDGAEIVLGRAHVDRRGDADTLPDFDDLAGLGAVIEVEDLQLVLLAHALDAVDERALIDIVEPGAGQGARTARDADAA